VGGAIIPVDLRMPGYPAFLATMYTLTGRTGADARLWVMLAQIGVDLLSCLVIARLAALLACTSEDSAPNTRVYSVALWLAVLCPFTANYTAVPLTESFALSGRRLACCALVIAIRRVQKPDFLLKSNPLSSPEECGIHRTGSRVDRWRGNAVSSRSADPAHCCRDCFWRIIFSARKLPALVLGLPRHGFGCLMISLPGRFETWFRWANRNSSLRKTQICRGSWCPTASWHGKKPGSTASAIATWCRGG